MRCAGSVFTDPTQETNDRSCRLCGFHPATRAINRSYRSGMYQPCLADLDDEVRIDHLSGVCNKLRDTCVRHRRVTAERENYDFLAFVPGKKIWGPLVVERLIRSPLCCTNGFLNIIYCCVCHPAMCSMSFSGDHS